MTVTVISKAPTYRVICTKCECELSFTKLDLERHHSRIPDYPSYDYITCANCRHMVTVPDKLPPARR